MAGTNVVNGGPGYDLLLGGAGDDRLTDRGHGSDRLDGGPGDDLIRSAAGGRDVVRCGAGRDRVEADRGDIVGIDCEAIARSGRGEDAHVPVLSAEGALIGHTARWRFSDPRGPLRLLWASAGNLAARRPGLIVAVGGGRSLRLRVP